MQCLLACKTKNIETAFKLPPPFVSKDTNEGAQFIAIIFDSTRENSASLTKMDLSIIDQQLKIAVNGYNMQMEQYLMKSKGANQKNRLKKKDLTIDLKNYRRQYVAYLNEKNQKEVWVNCFCSGPDNDEWKFKTIEVRDGGKCYFNLRINIDKGTYYEFYINGLA